MDGLLSTFIEENCFFFHVALWIFHLSRPYSIFWMATFQILAKSLPEKQQGSTESTCTKCQTTSSSLLLAVSPVLLYSHSQKEQVLFSLLPLSLVFLELLAYESSP